MSRSDDPARPRSGLVVVDKPAGWTSHDVVARARGLAGTRKVGHAGTLDPMATGVLVLGVGSATRLLGHLALAGKTYRATIRLGVSTLTDDAEGEVTAGADTSAVTDAAIADAARTFVGTIAQVPSAVSAVKVDGRRSYARVRAGEQVDLAARTVTVDAFDLGTPRRVRLGDAVGTAAIDVEAEVRCSTGTYIRALARDLGTRLGVGGHLTALRRTSVGPFDVSVARTLEQLAAEFTLIPLGAAAGRFFPRIDVDAAGARDVATGRPLEPPEGAATRTDPRPFAVFGPTGEMLALYDTGRNARSGPLRAVAVFADPTTPGAPSAADSHAGRGTAPPAGSVPRPA